MIANGPSSGPLTLLVQAETADAAQSLKQLLAKQPGVRVDGAAERSAKVIAVHGAKGGVGATTLACNVAAALHRRLGARVALVDADVFSGAAAVLLDLAPIRSVADLTPAAPAPSAGRPRPLRDVSDLASAPAGDQFGALLTREELEDVVVRHASGVHVLLAPEQLQDAEALRGEDLHRAIEALKPHYDAIVVDTSSNLTPLTLAALDQADKIVVVLTPELVPLRNASRFIELCRKLGYGDERVDVVINRADSPSEINTSVIRSLLRRTPLAEIPSDGPALLQCLNVGDLLVSAQPQHPYARCTGTLARTLALALGIAAGERAGDSAPHSSGRAAGFVGAVLGLLRRTPAHAAA